MSVKEYWSLAELWTAYLHGLDLERHFIVVVQMQILPNLVNWFRLMIFCTPGTPSRGSHDQYFFVSGKVFMPKIIFMARNACISSTVVFFKLASALFSIHWRAYRGLVPSTDFSKSSSGKRRRKKSRTVTSLGSVDVDPNGWSNSST